MVRRSRPGQPPIRDWHLWVEVKRTVEPLRPQAGRIEDEPLPIPAPPAADIPPAPVRTPGRAARIPSPLRPPQPSGGLEPRMRRRLRRGQIAIDATIDLHGMRQQEARSALHRFIETRAARGDRTILVITGKGLKKTDEMRILDRGVLRAMLPIWLAEPALAPLVAGYDSAGQGHGGEGAFYVRLRTERR